MLFPPSEKCFSHCLALSPNWSVRFFWVHRFKKVIWKEKAEKKFLSAFVFQKIRTSEQHTELLIGKNIWEKDLKNKGKSSIYLPPAPSRKFLWTETTEELEEGNKSADLGGSWKRSPCLSPNSNDFTSRLRLSFSQQQRLPRTQHSVRTGEWLVCT